jgi:hypothetical protein
MSFVAYCFICEKKVTVHTLLPADRLLSALSNDDHIEVMHTSENGDHRWRLNREEKVNLLNYIRKSL